MNKIYWQDDHITFQDNKYFAWDETGIDTVGEYKTMEEARNALTSYSNQLSGTYNEDSNENITIH